MTLAREFPRASVTGIDISPAALAVARRNAAAHGVAGRIAWIEGTLGDWLAGSSTEDGGGLDLLVANLPYVPTRDLGSLPPRSASTNPGSRWTEAPTASIRCVTCCVRRRPGSTPTPRLLVEMGTGQADALRELVAAASGVELLDIRPDLQGIPRTAVIAADRSVDAAIA